MQMAMKKRIEEENAAWAIKVVKDFLNSIPSCIFIVERGRRGSWENEENSRKTQFIRNLFELN